MAFKKTSLLAILPIVIFSFLFFHLLNLSRTYRPASQFCTSSNPCHEVKFYEENTFRDGIERAKKIGQPQGSKISGGIIPHHLFPSFIIADFYKRLSFQKPITIVIIGPNHLEEGNFKALTSLRGWETPHGIVEPDINLIQGLLERNILKVDEEVLTNDVSVAGSMPFIAYFLPKVKVVPVLLSGKMNKEESEIIADNLKNIWTEGVVTIASVDFSHYLTNKQAQEKDKVTLEVIKNFDYRQLYSLGNDYLDSPPSIGILLMVMQRIDKTKIDLLHNTNSGELQGNDSIETTSYFSLAFY